MVVREVKSQAEFNEIIGKERAVLLDCFATWCGPCKAISPLLEKHSNAKKYSDVTFLKIDVDELPELSQELGIRAMPTFILFENGEKSQELVGAVPAGLVKILDKVSTTIEAEKAKEETSSA